MNSFRVRKDTTKNAICQGFCEVSHCVVSQWNVWFCFIIRFVNCKFLGRGLAGGRGVNASSVVFFSGIQRIMFFCIFAASTNRSPLRVRGRATDIFKRRWVNVLSAAAWTSQLQNYPHGKAMVNAHWIVSSEVLHYGTRTDIQQRGLRHCLSSGKGNAKA